MLRVPERLPSSCICTRRKHLVGSCFGEYTPLTRNYHFTIIYVQFLDGLIA